MAIHIKTPEEIAGLRIAGRLASELLDYLTPFVKPGITTGELDKLAYDYTVNVQKCIPACLGYQPEGMTPYPATTCISINHVVCHGIPGEKKLKHGDIVNIDVTSIKDGFHGDTSRMFVVGKPTIAGKRLCDLAFKTMWAGIEAVRPGGTFNDIGVACQAFADKNGISVVRDTLRIAGMSAKLFIIMLTRLPAVLISRSTGWSPAPGLGSEHPQAHPSRSPSDDRSRT